MNSFTTLYSNRGFETRVAYDFETSFADLAEAGHIDAFIVATEDGFSPLGAERGFFAEDLGIPVAEISELAYWNRFKNSRVTLIALKSRRQGSMLRGVILAPSETSECYRQFAEPFRSRPYRDFYYNVVYESIAHAIQRWGARRLGISHLSGSGRFREAIAICAAEALGHIVDDSPRPAIDSFAFVGCCITLQHLEAIKTLNSEGNVTRHHPIQLEHEQRNGVELIHLVW